MSSAHGRQHARDKEHYKRQWFYTIKNFQKKWAKHLAAHPKDKQAKKLISKRRDRVEAQLTSASANS